MNDIYSLLNTGKMIAGRGSAAKAGEIAADIGAKTAAIITDQGILNNGLTDGVQQALAKAGVKVQVFSDTPPEPTVDQVAALFQQVQKFDGQLIIGIGGGSVIDTAKIISLLLTNPVGLRDLAKGKDRLERRGIPTLMIPTTAGTGAEATPNAIFLIPEEELKVGIVSEKMMADYVILDPEMTVGLPKHITANTGMDALCHAMECYISEKANPFSDLFALQSIKLIGRSILKAYRDGTDLQAREDMLLGAAYGGICIASSGTTAVHALSYPLGGKYHIPHGLANAILLPDVMKFNLDVCEERFSEIARAMGLPVEGDSSRQAAEKMIAHLYFLIEALNVKCDLQEKGINEAVLDELVEAASKVTRLLDNNPKPLTKADMKMIYQQLL